MANTYCGKDCDSCVQKEQQQCQGCRLGPGRSMYDGCEIAVCCKSKGHESCDTCTNNRYCGKRGRRDVMPDYRRRKQEAEADRKEMLARKAPFMGKWLWILFWLWIPSAVIGVLTSDVVVEAFPGLVVPGAILSFCCSLAYGVILLRLTPECERYRLAGILSIAAAAVSLFATLIGGAGWMLLLLIPAAIAGLVAEYQEFTAHGEVLSQISETLSGKWYRLWKWFIGVYIALIGSVVLMLIFPVLGLLVALAALIGLIVVSILKLVYLYRSAQEFRQYT